LPRRPRLSDGKKVQAIQLLSEFLHLGFLRHAFQNQKFGRNEYQRLEIIEIHTFEITNMKLAMLDKLKNL
jgi:hypothetical protein